MNRRQPGMRIATAAELERAREKELRVVPVAREGEADACSRVWASLKERAA